MIFGVPETILEKLNSKIKSNQLVISYSSFWSPHQKNLAVQVITMDSSALF